MNTPNPTEAEILAEEWPYSFAVNGDEEFNGHCPCGQIHGVGFEVDMHCWRTGRADGCDGSGVHISGTLSVDRLRRIAEHIRDHNGWTDHCDWHVVVVDAPT